MKLTIRSVKLDTELDRFEINQRFSVNERRKLAPTLENHTGSWRLFNGLAEQSNRVQFNLVSTSKSIFSLPSYKLER